MRIMTLLFVLTLLIGYYVMPSILSKAANNDYERFHHNMHKSMESSRITDWEKHKRLKYGDPELGMDYGM